MKAKPFLLFSLHNSVYGIDAMQVQEIFLLPELTVIAEAPPDISGAINLRGKFLPVMDLDVRFGYTSQDYQLTNSVIVIACQDSHLGIIVDQVREVEIIDNIQEIKQSYYGRDFNNQQQFVKGVAQVGEDIVMLLNSENLIRYSQPLNLPSESNGHPIDGFLDEDIVASELPISSKINRQRLFCPNATPEQREVFRQRAENLRQSTENEDLAGLLPLAVFGLGKEYFGFDLEIVREFTDVRKVTPVPCCPNYIIGNMNLRGEIITLVDICSVLKMDTEEDRIAPKAIVVNVDGILAGIVVDAVFDVMYVHPSWLSTVPIALQSNESDYLRGTVKYQEKMLSIVDLPKIFSQGNLVVNEEV